MSRLMNVAQTSPTSVAPDVTVQQAIEAMARDRVGGVLVLRDGKLAGIFTERDVMMKVVFHRRNPETTLISEVMTRDVLTIGPEVTEEEALALMIEHHIRHLPIQGDAGKVLGIVSIRNLLQDRVESLSNEVESLAAYMGADGPGG